MHRRDLLCTGAVAGTAALAGCSALEGILGTGSDGGTSGWSTYRGDPARSGVRSAAAGPGDSPEIAWELTWADLAREFNGVDDPSALQFTGRTSWPVVAGGVVAWTTGYRGIPLADDADSIDPTTRVVAADPVEGSVAWSATLSEEAMEFDEWFAPVGGNGRLYVPDVVGGDLGLTAYDAASGEELDRLDLGLPITVSQPLVVDGTVYAVEGDADSTTLRAFDAGDGTEEWSVEESFVWFAGRPGLTVADGAVWTVVRADPPAFVAHETADGGERTRIPLTDLPRSIDSRGSRPTMPGIPTVVDGRLFAAGGLRSALRLDLAELISTDTSGDGQWRHRPRGAGPGSIEDVLLERGVQGVSDDAIAEIRDAFALEDGYTTLTGYPVVVDGLAIAPGIGETGGDGLFGLFAVDAETGEEEWAVPTGEPGVTPVAAGETVYLTTSEGVEVVSTDGTHRGRVDLDGRFVQFEGSPALGEGRLLLATARGIVAFD